MVLSAINSKFACPFDTLKNLLVNEVGVAVKRSGLRYNEIKNNDTRKYIAMLTPLTDTSSAPII